MKKEYIPNNNPSVAGIISGICKGKIFTDNTHNPGIVITYSYCVGGYGIAGDVSSYTDEELKIVMEECFEELKKNGEEWFEFSSESQEINTRILNLYSDREIESEMEYSYRRSNRYEYLESLPQDIYVQEINHDFLVTMDEKKIGNREMFLDRFLESWKSEEDYLTYSKSVVAIKDNKIIGIIFGSARYNDVITIDIEVNNEYRRCKIGSVLTKTMMNLCAKEGVALQWDCVESNTASRALVRSLEFEPLKQRRYYWFPL